MSISSVDSLVSQLANSKKKDQKKALKKVTLSGDSMMSIFFKLWLQYGFTYSSYTFELLPSSISESDLPTLIQSVNNNIEFIGNTPLSEGQLKQVMDQRKRRIVRILDRGSTWHCFHQSISSIRGKEQGQIGSHVHYISSAFNHSREFVLSEFAKYNYQLPGFHVGFSK